MGTTMSDPVVTTEKKQQLADRMTRLGVRDNDLRETFILGSGPGGQKVNKTAACVRLHHTPTGIDIKCGRTRHRELNRFLARRLLCDRIEYLRAEHASARRQDEERIRRQKRRRSRRQRARMLADKRMHSDKKRGRAPVSAAND